MDKISGTDGLNINWVRLTSVYLFLVAILGVTLRLAFVIDLPEWIYYKNITHTHSHLAMLGWIYNALMILSLLLFGLKAEKYKKIFWVTQLSVIGMLFSFPIQGYGLFSIVFTSMHILVSYVFIIHVFRDLKTTVDPLHDYAVLFIKTALIFLFISTIGTLLLGVFMKTGLKGSALYYGAIQFFLHFQFNGWFIFGILALFLKFLHLNQIQIDISKLGKLYNYLIVATLLTFALAITWSTPYAFIFWINSLGVIIQLFALVYIWTIISNKASEIKQKISKWSLYLWQIAFICLLVKIIIQGLVAIPYLATISYTIKNFVIGFIHLLNLGFVSAFILGMFFHYCTPNRKTFILGIKWFILGLLGTEFILFFQGVLFWFSWGFFPYYYQLILTFSVALLIGTAYVALSFYKTNEKQIKIE